MPIVYRSFVLSLRMLPPLGYNRTNAFGFSAANRNILVGLPFAYGTSKSCAFEEKLATN